MVKINRFRRQTSEWLLLAESAALTSACPCLLFWRLIKKVVRILKEQRIKSADEPPQKAETEKTLTKRKKKMFFIPAAALAVTVTKAGLIHAGLTAGTIIYKVCKKD